MAGSHAGPKKKGMNDVTKANDYGGHAAFSAADSPSSVKSMASGSTKYKHRAS